MRTLPSSCRGSAWAVSSTQTGCRRRGVAEGGSRYGAVGRQTFDESGPGRRVDEAIGVERPDGGVGHVTAIAEDQLEVPVDGMRGRRPGRDRADVDTLVHRLEEAGKGGRPPGYRPGGGGWGVGVWFGKLGVHFFSLAIRMSRTEAPEACICIASRATSIHTAHVMPCGSHSVTSPLAARAITKQSSLPRCPLRSQPQ